MELLNALVVLKLRAGGKHVVVLRTLFFSRDDGVLRQLGRDGVGRGDKGGVIVFKRARKARVVDFLELEVLLVLGDAVRLGCAVLNFDGAGFLQQFKGAAFVGGVVRDRHDSAFGKLVKRLVLLRVEGSRRQVDFANRFEVTAGFLVVGVEEVLVLEQVRINRTVRQRRVGGVVVVELNELDVDAFLFGEFVSHVGEHFTGWDGQSADLQRGVQRCVFRILCTAATGGQCEAESSDCGDDAAASRYLHVSP